MVGWTAAPCSPMCTMRCPLMDKLQAICKVCEEAGQSHLAFDQWPLHIL